MKTVGYKLILMVVVVFLFACKQENNSIFSAYPEIAKLDEAYQASPSAISANELIKKLMDELKKGSINEGSRTQFLEYGLKVATDQKIPSKAAGFLYPLIKSSPDDAKAGSRIFELAGLMKKMRKESAANTLYKGLLENHSASVDVKDVAAQMTTSIDSISAYIRTLGEQLFENVDNTGINRKAAMSYVDACEAYGLVYPKAPDAADNLFKAAEVAKSIRTFPKSLALYDWILDKYPNYEKAPTSLFLKGFIIENNLGDDAGARKIYDEFLSTYPKHDLADDVEFLIENLGKTDEEILQMIEEKRKANEKKNS